MLMNELQLNRFIQSFTVLNGCWLWNKSINSQGYGKVNYANENLAHRLSYLQFVGPIKDGDVVRHKCFKSNCVNPHHLYSDGKDNTNRYVFENLIAKIETKIHKDVVSKCWHWLGYKNTQGYGKLRSYHFPGENLAHRISYLVYKGIIEKDLCVLHQCDNPSCINPDHLSLGTRDENNKDRTMKGRTITPNMDLTHCKRGHEFTESNTILRKSGTRLCRLCSNAGYTRRRKERKRNDSKTNTNR